MSTKPPVKSIADFLKEGPTVHPDHWLLVDENGVVHGSPDALRIVEEEKGAANVH